MSMNDIHSLSHTKGLLPKDHRRPAGAFRRGVYINLKFVLMEQNKDDFHGVLALARSMGATLQLISAVSPSARGACAITELGVKSDEDLRKIVGEWSRITNFYSIAGEFSYDDPICEAGRNVICVDPYGIVTPCNAFRYEIGNVRKKPLPRYGQRVGD